MPPTTVDALSAIATARHEILRCNLQMGTSDDYFANWVPEGSRAKFCWPVFLGFRQEIDPGTPLRSPPRKSICGKNQPRRPILRPFRCERRTPPDRLQVPRPNCLRSVLLSWSRPWQCPSLAATATSPNSWAMSSTAPCFTRTSRRWRKRSTPWPAPPRTTQWRRHSLDRAQ